ncbi:MAG: hypothetical protein ABH838_05400, partial [Actinomycetota bacterium]
YTLSFLDTSSMMGVEIPAGGVKMIDRVKVQRERNTKPRPHDQDRDSARFKAAVKVIKYSKGHGDKAHEAHTNHKH